MDFFIDKSTELSRLHIDYMSLISQIPITNLEDIENLIVFEHYGLNKYF